MQTLVSEEDKPMPVLDMSQQQWDGEKEDRDSRKGEKKKKKKPSRFLPKELRTKVLSRREFKTKGTIRRLCPKGFSELPHYAFDQNKKKIQGMNQDKKQKLTTFSVW